MIDFGDSLIENPISGSELFSYGGKLPDPKGKSTKNWAFLIHPLSKEDFKILDPKMERWIKKEKGNLFFTMANNISVQSFGKGYIQYLRYRRVIKISYGVFILIPYLPEQFEQADKQPEIIKAIIKAACLAKEMNCHYLGLGAYTSIITGNGKLLNDQGIILVTSGSTTTGIGAELAVLKACRAMKVKPANATVAIIGGTGAVGRPASVLLSDYFQKIIIVARNQGRLNSLFELIQTHTEYKKEIITSPDINWAISQSQVVVLATNKADAKELQINPHSFLARAVVCDLAIPKAITPEIYQQRQDDVLFFDGAIFRFPGKYNCANLLRMGSDHETFGCLLETMLLALDGQETSYSVGPVMDFAQIKTLQRLIKKYHPRISDLRYCGEKIPQDVIVSIRRVRKRAVYLSSLTLPQTT